VCTGEGLIALFRALAGVPPVIKADHLYCDMNGEPYRADEFGFAIIRAGGLFRDPSAFTAPADCWGDVGAASGPLFLVLIDAATRKGYAPGQVLAAFTSSESGERCGFVTRARPAQGVR
jgi:3-oxoacyl-[acyl-carrier-protein] synthase-1